MTKAFFNWRRWSWPTIIGLSAIVIILSYTWSRTSNIIRGPRLFVTSPLENSLVHEPLITIEGGVERVAHLRLNDGKIFADSQGHFREQLLLSPGYNIIKLEASDRFGRQVNQLIFLFYDEEKSR